MTERLLRPFRDQHIPVIRFVNQGHQVDFGPEGLRQILDLWLDSGADLGNHLYSHLNINNVPLDEYAADIVKGEPILRAALASRGKTLRYYRDTFLFTGPTPEIKKEAQEFMDSHGYRVAPVTQTTPTMSTRRFTPSHNVVSASGGNTFHLWNRYRVLEKRSVEVVGREFPQILLIHVSERNADLIPDSSLCSAGAATIHFVGSGARG